MNPGYIYVLQNKVFGAYIVKIGMTTREPDVRAREIYNGSTGVPLPFDIATAYSVGDCQRAEKQLHKRLRAYRLNGRREFFRTPPSVAAALVYETCAEINQELGLQRPSPYSFDKATTKNRPEYIDKVEERDPADGQPVTLINPSELRESPIGSSELTPEQLDRARILGMMLAKIYPSAYTQWIDSFSRDSHPERELRIWEHIAKAYLTVEEIYLADSDLKKEAFFLLLKRSWLSTDEVLRTTRLNRMTTKVAKRLLQAYELRPKPLLARREGDRT